MKLKRDGFKCIAYDRNFEYGAKLYIDHKAPYSLGGLTILSNIQTLFDECNTSKSNKYIDKYGNIKSDIHTVPYSKFQAIWAPNTIHTFTKENNGFLV